MRHKFNSVYMGVNEEGPAGQGFIPLGAELPLPLLPTDDEIVAGETGKGAAKLWDRLMPDAAGMLAADVVIEAPLTPSLSQRERG